MHGGAGNTEPDACILHAVSTWKYSLHLWCESSSGFAAPCDRTEKRRGGAGGVYSKISKINTR